MLDRKFLFILVACLSLAACGGGGGGGGTVQGEESGFTGSGTEGSFRLSNLDVSGTPRARPATIGALEI